MAVSSNGDVYFTTLGKKQELKRWSMDNSQITILDGVSGRIAVSPDSRFVAFTKTTPDQLSLFIVGTQRKNQQVVRTWQGETPSLIGWSPDGNEIAVYLGGAVVAVSLSNGETRELARVDSSGIVSGGLDADRINRVSLRWQQYSDLALWL